MAANTSITIGKLAEKSGVGVDTIRFYERRGLLPQPRRTASGYRIFAPEAAERIRFIRHAKDLGFSLDEIRKLLELQDEGGRKSAVRALTQQKITEIDARIADLKRMRNVLQDLSDQCTGRGSVAACPIIEALSGQDSGAGNDN